MEDTQTVKTQTVLVVARHDYLISNIEKLLQGQGFNVLCSTQDEEVLKKLKSEAVDLLFVGGSVEPNSKAVFTSFLAQNDLPTRYVEHYGGPATILTEVREALAQ